MKKFENPKEMYLKVVALQEESCDILQRYIENEGISTENYNDKLYKQYNEVADWIFSEMNGKSLNLEYLTNNTENEDGDCEIISAFIRAYITDRILDEIIYFEDLVESENA